MTGWTHVRESQDPLPECRDCWDEHIEDICMEPQPDPTSPCGFVGCQQEVPARYVDAVHDPIRQTPRFDDLFCHPHAATMCLDCGHPITEVPA